MQWGYRIYIDGCLLFGLHSAQKLFSIMADLLSWIGLYKGISQIHLESGLHRVSWQNNSY